MKLKIHVLVLIKHEADSGWMLSCRIPKGCCCMQFFLRYLNEQRPMGKGNSDSTHILLYLEWFTRMFHVDEVFAIFAIFNIFLYISILVQWNTVGGSHERNFLIVDPLDLRRPSYDIVRSAIVMVNNRLRFCIL